MSNEFTPQEEELLALIGDDPEKVRELTELLAKRNAWRENLLQSIEDEDVRLRAVVREDRKLAPFDAERPPHSDVVFTD